MNCCASLKKVLFDEPPPPLPSYRKSRALLTTAIALTVLGVLFLALGSFFAIKGSMGYGSSPLSCTFMPVGYSLGGVAMQYMALHLLVAAPLSAGIAIACLCKRQG